MLPLDERGRAAAARLKDRYTFEGFLGQGGFAAVYRVRNLRLDRVEALKVLFEARGSDPKFAARFEREARIAASLEHPNVVRVYAFGETNGQMYQFAITDCDTAIDITDANFAGISFTKCILEGSEYGVVTRPTFNSRA